MPLKSYLAGFYLMLTFTLLCLIVSCVNRKQEVPVQVSSSTESVIPVYFSELADPLSVPRCEGRILPLKYRIMAVDYKALRSQLLAPEPGSLTDTFYFAVPLPDGTIEEFIISPSQTMAPELAAKYPQIRTYSGKSMQQPGDQIRLEITPLGFSSMITSTRGTMMIDPFCKGDSSHVIVYNRSDLPPDSKQPFEGK